MTFTQQSVINYFKNDHLFSKMADSDDAELLRRVRQINERDDCVVEQEWKEASEETLLEEIETYRALIRQLSTKLQPPNNHPTPSAPVQQQVDPDDWQVPPHCIPILAEVTTYDWKQLSDFCQFDVILMDPPWQLATSNPTRGVALGYGQLSEKDILNLPIPSLQSNGLLFIWVINSSFDFAVRLFSTWGYTIVDEIVWAKLTVNRRLAKSHGYYLQHAKETCLVGIKGKGTQSSSSVTLSDVLLSQRRGQSQKPNEIYDLIEGLVPEGRYLEIFARKNNLRDFWVSIGDEVIGAMGHLIKIQTNEKNDSRNGDDCGNG